MTPFTPIHHCYIISPDGFSIFHTVVHIYYFSRVLALLPFPAASNPYSGLGWGASAWKCFGTSRFGMCTSRIASRYLPQSFHHSINLFNPFSSLRDHWDQFHLRSLSIIWSPWKSVWAVLCSHKLFPHLFFHSNYPLLHHSYVNYCSLKSFSYVDLGPPLLVLLLYSSIVSGFPFRL